MSRRTMTTHVKEDSLLSNEFDSFKKYHGLQNNSETMRYVMRKEFRKYKQMPVLLDFLMWSWLVFYGIVVLSLLFAEIFPNNMTQSIANHLNAALITISLPWSVAIGVIIGKLAKWHGVSRFSALIGDYD